MLGYAWLRLVMLGYDWLCSAPCGTPAGNRGFSFEISLLSPSRPVLRNGNPLRKFLGNAFTGERFL